MEYNERDVSDDEQIVEEGEHEESEDEEDDESEDEENDEPEEEEDEEPEGGDDEEKNPWVGMREQVEERHKEKLEASDSSCSPSSTICSSSLTSLSLYSIVNCMVWPNVSQHTSFYNFFSVLSVCW